MYQVSTENLPIEAKFSDGTLRTAFPTVNTYSCTELGNNLASVWGRKQAATKESM